MDFSTTNNNKTKKISDTDLIKKYISSSDSIYVAQLFERYVHLITSLALKQLNNQTEAEDAVMEIFEILVRDLPKQEIKNFSPWLYSVVKNHCFKKLRKPNLESKSEDLMQKNYEFVMESDEELDLSNKMAKEQELNNLENAIKLLTQEQKECVELFYLKEKTYVEVAELTGYDLKKVKSYIQNGKRNLKNILEQA